VFLIKREDSPCANVLIYQTYSLVMRYFIIILVVTFSFLDRSSAQESGSWHTFTNSATPTCMIEDGQYLWVGTDAGLVKFDKLADTSQVFNSSNSLLPQNKVNNITRDKAGAIWATTYGGVVRIQGGVWTKFTTSNTPMPSNNTNPIAADSLGRVWIGSGSGLLKFDGGQWTIYTSANSPLVSNSIYMLATDRASNVWIATSWISDSTPQLLKFDGAASWEVHSISTDVGYYGSNAFSMMVSRDNSLWIGMEGYIAHVQNRKWTVTAAMPDGGNGPGYNYIFALTEDRVKNVWASTGYGIGYFDGLSWKTKTRYTGTYPFERSRGVILDGSDLWVAGYEAGGIAKLKDSTWTVFSNLSNCSLSSNYIQAMTMDSRGRYWFSGRFDPTLSMFDGKSWKNYDSVLHGSFVQSLAADSSGNIWIGENGITKFDGEKAMHFDLHQLDSNSNVIYALLWDKKRGTLWVGNGFEGSSGYHSGLIRYDGEKWRTYLYPSIYGQIQSLALDTSGNIWASPYDANITEFDGDTTFHYFNYITLGLASDAKGNVWASTSNGPAKWDGTSWQTFSGSGILTGGLDGCTVDANGNAWFSDFPNMGIGGGACEYDGKNWQAFTPANSGIGSGMVWSIMAGKNGELWFGSNGAGVAEFIPSPSAGVSPFSTQHTSDFTIYPNPTTGILHIQSTSNNIVITDLLGRTRMRGVAEAGAIDVSSLPKGVYSIGDGKSRSRFVKE